MPAPAFLDGSADGLRAPATALALAARAVGEGTSTSDGPLSAGHARRPRAPRRRRGRPRARRGPEAALALVGERIVPNSVRVTHPLCAAHLHCPPLIAALAAEAVIRATNQSLDSWDQAPVATHLEQGLIAWLGRRFGLGERADGVFTSGGT